MTDVTSYFPRAFSIDLGMSYDQVIKLVIGQGIRRIPVKLPIPPILSSSAFNTPAITMNTLEL